MTTTHVALLYSMVLARGAHVVMADLRALAADLGFGAPRTVVASGNLVLEAEEADPRAIEARLEPAFAARLGRAIPIIVRPADGWPRLLAGNPFAEAAAKRPDRVAARVMRAPAPADLADRLGRYCSNGERIAVVEGDVWAHFPEGQGRSRLAGAFTPARCGVGTFRNVNTLVRIGAALDAGGGGRP